MRALTIITAAVMAVIGLAAGPASAAPDFAKTTITAAPAEPREADVVTFTVVLRNTGADDAGAVYVSVEWPLMSFLVDITGLDGAEIDHQARTATLTLPLAAGAERQVMVRVLAPRDSGGDTLTLALRMSHFWSDTEWWDRTSVTVDTRLRQDGVAVGGLRVAPAGLATFAVLGAGVVLWLVLLARSGRSAGASGLAARLGPGTAALAITTAVGFWALFATMAWRDYRSLTAWPETTCTVLGGRLSAVATTRSSTSPATGQTSRDDTSYVPVLGLVYDVAGRRTYSSGFDTGSRLGVGGRGGRLGELAQWTVGTTTPCWYDPADPLDVVVLRGFGGAYLFALLPLPVFLLGIWRARSLLAVASSRS